MYFCCFLCRLFSDSDVLVLDSPENCCKMPAERLTETTVIPERCVCRSACMSVDVCAHMCDRCLSPHSSTYTHTHTYTYAHTHAHTHMHDTHTNTHTYTHAHAHTHTYTCTHTHILAQGCFENQPVANGGVLLYPL